MRRPLKPFVTEYKQSNRRSQTLPTEPGGRESERPSPRHAELSFKEPEESYEAALRAADALFAPPPESGSPPIQQDDRREPSPDMVATDPQPAVPSQAAGPEKPVGRILRVLDEEPSPEYVALEAARAPKRRGRKPGSKNKPKVPGIAVSTEPPVVAVSHSTAKTKVAISATRTQPAVTQVAGLVAASTPVSREGKRFSWVRDRLRPGEDWKRRRLPRVCW